MAYSTSLLPLILLLILHHIGSANGCFTSIFSFGDSIADTGNLLISKNGNMEASRPPYGQTFFHRPTGRYSDGRLIIDFIADALGFPFIRPFLAGPGDGGFRRGVNFAVAGATALDSSIFMERGIYHMWTNLSLSVQIRWFKELLPSLCSTDADCRDLLGSSLFLAGEIGGNDYNYQILERKPVAEIKSYVPGVVQAIGALIDELIDLGAKTLLVPGNFPLGCIPSYLTMFRSSDPDDYDRTTGCIAWLNDLAQRHNRLLKQELYRLSALHPHASIIYADYYGSIMSIISGSGKGRLSMEACCGGGGTYNVDPAVPCGHAGTTVCDDPSSCLSWDGMHFTEAAYRAVAAGLLDGPFAHPSLNEACSITKVSYADV